MVAAIPTLKSLISDPKGDVREAATEALRRVQPEVRAATVPPDADAQQRELFIKDLFVLTAADSADGQSHDAASRAIQGVVTGVGFLGAGAILRGDTEISVRGMTTAASIWLAAASGIACGLAQWALVATGVTLGLMVLVLAPVERILHNRRKTDRPDGGANADTQNNK